MAVVSIPAVVLRLRSEVRGRWKAWLGLAVLIGLASGAVMALAAGARRTDTAYDRFLRAQNAYDALVINYPSDETAVYDLDEIARLPQVADSARAQFEYYTFNAGNLASADGRIGTELNRFKIVDGRRADPRDPTELVVGFALAEDRGIEVGDTVPILPREFVDYVKSPETVENPFPESDIGPEEIAATLRFLEIVPDAEGRVVGIEASPGEFPPQFQLNRPLVHMTPALYRAFGQLGEDEHEALMVRLRGGDAGVDEFVAELERRSRGLPPQVLVQRDHAAAVQRSIHFQAVALWLLAGLTAVAVILILGQLLARLTYSESSEHPTLRSFGMRPRDLTVIGVLRAGAIAAAGAVIAAVVALLASPLLPTGLARTAEPDPGFRADVLVLTLGIVGTVLVLSAASLWPAWRASRASVNPAERWSRRRVSRAGVALTSAGAPVPATVGVRMALERGRGRSREPVPTTLLGVTLGILALVAALTFGASLGHLLDTPRLYGATWDFELVDFESGTLDPEALEIVRSDDRVEAVATGTANFGEPIQIEGHRLDVLVLGPEKGEISPPILEGRAPAAPDEITLGPRTLRTLDADVGDVVEVRVPGVHAEPEPMRIVGKAVFPSASEFAQLGEGALVTPAGAVALGGESDDPEGLGLVVRLRAGADRDAVIADFTDQLGGQVFPYDPGKPTDVVNFGRVEATPFVLGGIIAAISAGALAHLVISAARQRRRDLAILKTLGFVRRQVAETISWHAMAVVVVGLVAGIPLGVALGRWVWSSLADNLGVVSSPQVPLFQVLIAILAAIVLANVIAFVPGWFAARATPATDLRSE